MFFFQLKSLTNTSFSFLVPLLQANEEGLIQVINDQELDSEIRFVVSVINHFGLCFMMWFFNFLPYKFQHDGYS